MKFQVEILQPDSSALKYALDQLSDIGFKVSLSCDSCSLNQITATLDIFSLRPFIIASLDGNINYINMFYKMISIEATYGRWLIDGYPKVVLFDIISAAWKLDQWKQEVLIKNNFILTNKTFKEKFSPPCLRIVQFGQIFLFLISAMTRKLLTANF